MRAPASRNRLLTFSLAGVCAVLAVLAFVPPRLTAGPEIARRAPVAPLGQAGAPEAPGPTLTSDGPAFQRPIFVPSRRMPDSSGSSGSVGGLTLKAVFLGPGTEKALVLSARAREGVWVTPGQTIDGWRIEEIRTESVILTGPEGRRELSLEKPEAAPPGSTPRRSGIQRKDIQPESK